MGSSERTVGGMCRVDVVGDKSSGRIWAGRVGGVGE